MKRGLPSKLAKDKNLFIYTEISFFNIKKDILEKFSDGIVKLENIKNLKDFISLIEESKKDKKLKIYKTDIVAFQFGLILDQLNPKKVYSLGNNYADLICSLVCKKRKIPFIVIDCENPKNKIKENHDLYSKIYENSTSIISLFDENVKLTFKNNNQMLKELKDIINQNCNYFAVITPSFREPWDTSIKDFVNEPIEDVDKIIYLIKIK